ncbi:MAG: ABC transporter permease [Alphaproteobacteria bacterium]|jgi:peptide/nickel transport system permease protein|nr:ABC transporter permease [Alphaproteobacteria bacterium]
MTAADIASAHDLAELRSQKTLPQKAADLIRKQPLGAFGGAIVLLMMVMAVFAPFLTAYDPVDNSFPDMLLAPNADHWMGTDQFGRDVLTRIIFGARTALMVGLVSAFLGATIGLMLGVASGYFGGTFDLLFNRIVDVFMSFPTLIMALAIVSVLGSELHHVILAITTAIVPRSARIVRSNALQISEFPYIDAARALGFRASRIILRHMLPNVMAPYLIIFTGAIGRAILAEAALSYLGLGVQEPTATWGLMLQGGAEDFAESAPWMAFFPGFAIALAVFGFFMLGDAMRDAFDPRLRRQ